MNQVWWAQFFLSGVTPSTWLRAGTRLLAAFCLRARRLERLSFRAHWQTFKQSRPVCSTKSLPYVPRLPRPRCPARRGPARIRSARLGLRRSLACWRDMTAGSTDNYKVWKSLKDSSCEVNPVEGRKNHFSLIWIKSSVSLFHSINNHLVSVVWSDQSNTTVLSYSRLAWCL